MTYTVLIYACMYTKTPIACFLLRLKNPDTKTPHTCLSQPHGGYCLHEAVLHTNIGGSLGQKDAPLGRKEALCLEKGRHNLGAVRY
jgi:hypothetical protein